MPYNFWWTAPSGGVPIISIANYGITFNSGAIEMLGRPQAVLIGYDEENRVLGIKPLQDSEAAHPKAFRFIERERQGYVRIGCKDFVKLLASRTERDFTMTTRYAARRLDESDNLFIVALDRPLDTESDHE
jgi:hypothetical protein